MRLHERRALSPKTWQDVAPGGIVLYDDSLPIPARRDDVTYYPMPVNQLVKEANLPYDLKDYIANMVYVGVLAHLLDIDMAEIREGGRLELRRQAKAVELNMDMVERAYAWAQEQPGQARPFPCRAHDRLQRGQDAGRRQHRGGPGRRLRRRHLRRLVSRSRRPPAWPKR